MSPAPVEQILDLLGTEYGRPRRRRRGDPVSVLVKTILSQNTSDTNSDRAFERLKVTFPRWEDLLTSDSAGIVTAIREGGLGQIKARRLKQALGELRRLRGRLELDFLKDLPPAEAREWLKQLPGVGNKTANVVLLFALGKPALPVDTHVFRVSRRLGLISPQASLDEAHQVLERLVPPSEVYAFHLLMIEHGRKTCTARNPKCLICVLRKLCPSYEKFVGHPASNV
ncbi:MAG: endonuclease III [Chloroflexota bacterium]